mmetsp:Transcript_127385/g.360428  ORF Transcript_127385/g.360428 Transcript_127385/m.360428 type:complete len:217 (-) Transcript_127385:1539-2189(-)
MSGTCTCMCHCSPPALRARVASCCLSSCARGSCGLRLFLLERDVRAEVEPGGRDAPEHPEYLAVDREKHAVVVQPHQLVVLAVVVQVHPDRVDVGRVEVHGPALEDHALLRRELVPLRLELLDLPEGLPPRGALLRTVVLVPRGLRERRAVLVVPLRLPSLLLDVVLQAASAVQALQEHSLGRRPFLRRLVNKVAAVNVQTPDVFMDVQELAQVVQ